MAILATAGQTSGSAKDAVPDHYFRALGIMPRTVHTTPPTTSLIETALARGEGRLTDRGAFVALTGSRTGRSPKDRFLVSQSPSREHIWWGTINQPIEPAYFDRLLEKVREHWRDRELFINDGWACADPRHRLNVRVVAEKAWHAAFARCLFLRPGAEDLANFQPGLTILHAADLFADPATDGTRSETFIVFNLERGLVLIGGTYYAGEVKKAVFSFLNYALPGKGVFPMHCAANLGPAGDTALFFGLSGTGKTTLSADADRRLIGDDEHAWSEHGIFNLEGGCYAKCIRLSHAGEPQIWKALRFGSVLENVVVDERTRIPDFNDESHTENTRAAYPVDFIDNCELSGQGGHPNHIIFLTCDSFGVLPPLSRLTTEQALYHFLSGYTAKVAGTEDGVTEPEATFSTCFAAPFLPLHPTRYADMLHDKLRKHGSQVWLVNTGWSGGVPGHAPCIRLDYTRAMVRAALTGELTHVPFRTDSIFATAVPESCPGVPADVLQPKKTWNSNAVYEANAKKLASLFHENFAKYADQATAAVRLAGPRLA